jgi:hypothetical protein
MTRQIVALSVALLAIVVRTAPLLGQEYDQVDFSSQANWTWAGIENLGFPNGVFLPGAPTGVTTLGGIPFDIRSNNASDQAWNADIANTGSGQVSITMNVNVYGVTNVYTLINTFAGQPGPNSYASLIFTGAGGASYTKSLIGNIDIRDYNHGGGWTDFINGTTTTNVFRDTDIYDNPGVLDMQNIALPSAFASQTLTTIELVDNGGLGIQRVILDGVTVASSPTPETSTLALLGVGAAGLLVYGWRRRG